jgi:DNA-binding IclR family transcriptional regulator
MRHQHTAAPSPMRAQVAEPLYTATRTLAALELLAFAPCSAPVVAARLQVHPRTARRLLKQLAADEWVVRGADGQYALTLRLMAMAGQALTRCQVYEPLRSAVIALADTFPARFDGWIPSYRDVLGIATAEASPSGSRLLPPLAPRHCSAGGKALLATRDAWRETALAEPLPPHTEHTIVDAAALAHACNEIAARGIATEDQEFELGRWALAAPILDATGSGLASLSATARNGPLEVDGEIGTAVREHAAQISGSLRLVRG